MMKKNKVAYILSICFLITVVTSCSQNTESITTVTSEVSSVQQETESDTTEITELDETDFSSNQEETDDIEDLDTEWGYSMIRTYENSLLTDQQSLVIKYFDNKYFSIKGNYNYEVLKRNAFEFEGAQIEFIGTVRKVLSSAEDDFSALVWIGRTEDEFYYRSLYEEGAYERYLEETKDNMVIIQGDQLSSRVIEGDRIDVKGTFVSCNNIDIDGNTLYIPEVEVSFIAFNDGFGDSQWFDANYIYKVAKAILGDSISIRDAEEGVDYDENPPGPLMFYQDPYMVIVPDNQTNAKFSKFFFHENTGLIEPEIKVASDLAHFYLIDSNNTSDGSLKTISIECYNPDFSKIWKREFEQTSSYALDYTNSIVYLVTDSDLHFIDVNTGEDTKESVYVGSVNCIHKVEDGVLLFSYSSVMKVNLEGNIIWETEIYDVPYQPLVQYINGRYAFSTYDAFYFLNTETGEIEMETQFLE